MTDVRKFVKQILQNQHWFTICINFSRSISVRVITWVGRLGEDL